MSIYGLLISVAIFVSIYRTEFLLKKYEKNSEFIWDFALIGITSGIIGARVYHVISLWGYYAKNPISILYLWNGGLSFFGAFFGGFIGLVIFTKIKKVSLIKYLDFIAVTLPLAQSIGRIGNYFNQELYGLPLNKPFGIFIDIQHRPEKYIDSAYFHPLFLYEIILNLGSFLVLNRLLIKKPFYLGTGYFVFFYILLYSVIRFMLEFLRIESWTILGTKVAQAICVILFSFSLYKLKKIKV